MDRPSLRDLLKNPANVILVFIFTISLFIRSLFVFRIIYHKTEEPVIAMKELDDTLSYYVSTNTVDKNNESAKKIALILDSREFFIRAGYIILLNYYIDDEHISDILSLCEKESNYYYVNMSVSWLISYCFIGYKEKVLELFKSKKLSPFVQNKAISKIRESYRVSKEDKEYVKKFTL